MAHRNLGKVMITGTAMLALVAGTTAVAVRYVASDPPDAVGLADDIGDTQAAGAPSGDDHRQSTGLARAKAGATGIEPPPAPPPPPTEAPDDPPAGSGGNGGGSTTTCPLPAYPSAACTGVPAGTNLAVHDGDLEVTTPNTIIDGQDIQGCVTIGAPGAVIRRSRITCSGFIAVASFADAYSGAGPVLEDVEISCGGANGTTGVGDVNVTIRRANIHSCENGFDVDGNMTIEHSYVHDLVPYDPATDPHPDGAQITPVGNNIRIVHNTIYAGDGTSAIITPTVSRGVVSNVLIQDNLMAGGAYTLYCQQDGPGDGYRVIGNHFSTRFYPKVGAYGAWTDCADETEVTGNVYHESGQPVQP
jgi:hypothetical protein